MRGASSTKNIIFWGVCFGSVVLATRIEGFSFSTTGATPSLLPNQLVSSRRETNRQQQQRVSPLYHQFNPLRINEDGSTKPIATPKRRLSLPKIPFPSSSSLDTSAIAKYITAIVIQMSLGAILFKVLDLLVGSISGLRVPFAVNAVGMYFLALKSRVFNPLSNPRPQSKTLETTTTAVKRRTMPTWTPPGVVFPIVWLLLIGPLRAITSAMVIAASGGTYATPALMALLLHLSIGDVWNTINNVEQRYGTSVLGVLCVWLSAAHAAYQFGQVRPLAGKLLAIKLVWLTIATSLVTRTWQLNPMGGNTTAALAPLLPTKGDGVQPTRLEWFSNKSTTTKEG